MEAAATAFSQLGRLSGGGGADLVPQIACMLDRWQRSTLTVNTLESLRGVLAECVYHSGQVLALFLQKRCCTIAATESCCRRALAMMACRHPMGALPQPGALCRFRRSVGQVAITPGGVPCLGSIAVFLLTSIGDLVGSIAGVVIL